MEGEREAIACPSQKIIHYNIIIHALTTMDRYVTTMHMKKQKRKNAKTQKYNPVDLSGAEAIPLWDLGVRLEIQSLTQSIKLLQKIRRDKLAAYRRKKR